MMAADRGDRLILASTSPRRADLLRQVTDIEFDIVSPSVEEETFFIDTNPDEAVRLAALAKALSVAARHPDALVIGADTVAVCDGEVMGKPVDSIRAREMLRRLRGREHRLLTGIAVARGGEVASDVVCTLVEMRAFTDEELELYLASGEPLDKAGAYAVQGRGALLVKKICGCYYNVIGLPLARLEEMLLGYGVTLFADRIS